MIYQFRYKKFGFFKKVAVIGHGYMKDMDRMVLYHQNGSITEIPGWSKYHCKLGVDWVLAKKKDMESKTGQTVIINRDLDAK